MYMTGSACCMSAPPNILSPSRLTMRPALLLALALALALALSHPPLASAMTVCVVHDPPFTICPSATYQGYVKEDSSISGYDVDLLRWVLKDMGFTMDPAAGDADPQYMQYAWRCGPELHWSSVEAASHDGRLSSGPWPLPASRPSPPGPPSPPSNGSTALQYICDISIGDFSVSSSNVEQGSLYLPYYPTGVAVLTTTTSVSTDAWAFMKPFHWTLWLGFMCFIFTVPSIVFFVERLSVDGMVPLNRQGMLDLGTAQYQTLLAVFNLAVYEVTSLSAQICIISFCFMVLIVVQTYNAQLGALYVSSQSAVSVSSINDFHDKSVGVLAIYAPVMQQEYPKINFVPYSADNTDSLMAQVLPDIDSKVISAFVHDIDALPPRIAQLANPCKYQVLTSPLAYKFSYGFLFSSAWNRSVVLTDFYVSLVHAQEAFVDTNLLDTYITSLPTCAILSLTTDTTSGVTFKQLSGLFIVVGVVTAATLLAGVAVMAMRVYRAMNEDDDGAAAEEAPYAPSVGSSKKLASTRSKRSLSNALGKVFVKQPSAPSGLQLSPSVLELRASWVGDIPSGRDMDGRGTTSVPGYGKGVEDPPGPYPLQASGGPKP